MSKRPFNPKSHTRKLAPVKKTGVRQLRKAAKFIAAAPRDPVLDELNSGFAGCDEKLILKRLSRIEENYAEIDFILSSLESRMPTFDTVDPRKPR